MASMNIYEQAPRLFDNRIKFTSVHTLYSDVPFLISVHHSIFLGSLSVLAIFIFWMTSSYKSLLFVLRRDVQCGVLLQL